MNQRNRIQMIAPNMLTASTCTPFTLRGAVPHGLHDSRDERHRTGLPTTSAMKIVRRDHSISPIERPNTRQALVRNDSERAEPVVVVIASPDT